MNKRPVILKAESVHKSYRMGATHVKVLKGADLTVREGGIRLAGMLFTMFILTNSFLFKMS